eukprot:symbB.v1.2.037919.t1/scaffold5739.1/size24072/3
MIFTYIYLGGSRVQAKYKVTFWQTNKTSDQAPDASAGETAVGGAATGSLDASFCTNQRAQACKLSFVPFVDSAELACGALTAQRGTIFFTIPQVKQGEVYIHVNLPTESMLYDDVYYWSALKHANSDKVSDKPVRKLLMGSHSVNALWARAV